MPDDVRRLYERAIADLKPTQAAPLGLAGFSAGAGSSVDGADRAAPLDPSSLAQTSAVRIAIGLALAAIVMWLLAR